MKMLLGMVLWLVAGAAIATAECPDLLNFSARPLRGGESVNFCEAYRGKVILAVNTASRCGYTPQFKGLEALYQQYRDRGLVVLGFPSDDFKQEYAQPEKTAEVCYLNYGVTFPMFTKSHVSGGDANAFFKKLASGTGVEPQWNFHKYLIDRSGVVLREFPSRITPESTEIRQTVDALLTSTVAPGPK